MCKKLVCSIFVAFALCTTAMAVDIAFYVGAPNPEGWYDVATMTADVATIIDQAGYLFKDIQQFNDSQLDAFGAWVDKNTNDGEMDIIWLNGCMPSVLYPLGNAQPDGSRAEKWLDGGNMFINIGDYFGYISYEGGARSTIENQAAGAANILDLDASIISLGPQGVMNVTADGQEYLPSLNAVAGERPVSINAVVAPWEVAAIFGENTAGTYADPIVIRNTETNGYLAIINQATTWINDRGQTCVEFIVNWVKGVIDFGGNRYACNPDPADAALVSQTWAILGWIPGAFAASHDVYMGDNFDDVNDATVDSETYLANLDLKSTYYAAGYTGYPYPDGLIPGTTYYWRIDEVNEAEPNSPWKGQVWSFTVKPPGAAEETVEYQVSISQDDGYAINDQLQNLDNDYLKVGSPSFTQPPFYASAMIFRNINISQGSEITSAYLKIRSYNSRLTDVVYGTIQAEATDDAGEFGGSRSIGSLVKTNTSIDWDLDEPWLEDTWYTSPDIAGVIQELINRAGWSEGNSLAIIYGARNDEGGYRNISSFDRGIDYAPILEITYIP